MQIELTGTHAEVSTSITELARLFTVVSTSKPYPVYERAHPGCARPIPGVVRVHLEVTR